MRRCLITQMALFLISFLVLVNALPSIPATDTFMSTWMQTLMPVIGNVTILVSILAICLLDMLRPVILIPFVLNLGFERSRNS